MKFSVTTLVVALVGFSTTFARSIPNRMEIAARSSSTGCSGYGNVPVPPDGDSQDFQNPSGLTLKAITQGLGYQNYTCDTVSGKYYNLGGTGVLDNICGGYTGHYYWQPDPSDKTAIVPVFDFRTSGEESENKFVMADLSKAAKGDNSDDLEWEKLVAIQGSFAKDVFQVNTLGGVAPTGNCNEGAATVQIGFQAQYWFFA